MDSLVIILLLAAVVMFWWDSMGVKEQARQIGSDLCRRSDVQFLDDTVALNKITVKRNTYGRLCFYRIFRFEFSNDNSNRFTGKIYMLGRYSDKVEMDPYPFTE
ncbi:MAG: DUF3301 domain-containing protein [Gammaproteobacteria bacterium]|nr:DUF3301 domain-containing protein [Gammaproteobacteria bacterium]